MADSAAIFSYSLPMEVLAAEVKKSPYGEL